MARMKANIKYHMDEIKKRLKALDKEERTEYIKEYNRRMVVRNYLLIHAQTGENALNNADYMKLKSLAEKEV